MWPDLLVTLALAAASAPTETTGHALTSVNHSALDAGCWYIREGEEWAFLMSFASPPLEGGPTAFLGLDGEEVPLTHEHMDERFLRFRGENLGLEVHEIERIDLECGDECAGSQRRVRVELIPAGHKALFFNAIEYCGC